MSARVRFLLVVLALIAPASGDAQQPNAQQLLARADAAIERGDTATARAAYRATLEVAELARALYQLARLEDAGSAGQIRLLRRYTELVPEDAWGFAALGEAYA
ncbi:MAG: hypothetical protein ACREK1_10460, partial [Longimicrobiales bacterium]